MRGYFTFSQINHFFFPFKKEDILVFMGMSSALKQALVGAAVSAGLFGVYLLLRQGSAFSLSAFVEYLLVVACFGAMGTFVAGRIKGGRGQETHTQQMTHDGTGSGDQRPAPVESKSPEPSVDAAKLARLERALDGRNLAALSMVNERLLRVGMDLDRLKNSYKDLYHKAPVMYFSLDAEGRLVTFNDTLVGTLGYQRDELAGRLYKELLAPLARTEWEDRSRANGKPGHPLARGEEMETLWHTKDGAILDVWIRSVPVYNDEGKFERFRSAALDLTERNRLAKESRARGDKIGTHQCQPAAKQRRA